MLAGPTVTPDDALAAFATLSTWKRGDRRAPHKPLLVLLALGEWQRGNHGPLEFAAVESRLRDLLGEFGPPGAGGPEDPFWRLRRDGVWELGGTAGLPDPGMASPPGLAALRGGVTGRFTAPLRAALARSPALVGRIARTVLEAHFPPTLHLDILAAVGLDVAAAEAAGPTTETRTAGRSRDPRFRDGVLRAYGECCAVCGVGMRFARTAIVIGVEAAHIMWFQAGGPDDVSNGLALCALHHKAFDLGAFTLDSDGRILISADVCGVGVEDAIGRYHNRPIRPRAGDGGMPTDRYLKWHRDQVFRGDARA